MNHEKYPHNLGKQNKLIVLFIFAIVLFYSSLTEAEPTEYFNVSEFGAIGDGKIMDTQAIQKAIDAANGAGGGTVYFPAGTYLSGTLMMRNHVTLHLEGGSTLLGSTNLVDFPSTPPRFRSYTENYVHQSLLFGEDLVNITIEGRGTIDGQGTIYRELDRPFRQRPYLIRLVNCRNVLVRDITLQNSPFWVQHYLACDDLVISGIRVNSFEGLNNDGLDIDCCRNVRVSNCYIHSHDDAIALKSTSNQTCENITITNCVLSTASQGIKLGTESNGGFRNITMTNCTIRKPGLDENDWNRTARGVAAIGLMIIDGGVLERVNISNINVRGMDAILFVRVRNRARPFLSDGPKPKIGKVRDIHISNIIARDIGARGSDITGLPGHAVENINISNIDIIVEGGEKDFPSGYVIKEVLEGDPALKLDHATKMKNLLPSYGFYVRHVKGIRFSNINIGLENPDQRPALICDDVQNLEIDRYIGPSVPGGSPIMDFINTQNAIIRGCPVLEGTDVFLHFAGVKNKHFTVVGNDLSFVKTPFEFDIGTSNEFLYQSYNRVK